MIQNRGEIHPVGVINTDASDVVRDLFEISSYAEQWTSVKKKQIERPITRRKRQRRKRDYAEKRKGERSSIIDG